MPPPLQKSSKILGQLGLKLRSKQQGELEGGRHGKVFLEAGAATKKAQGDRTLSDQGLQVAQHTQECLGR